MQKCTIINNSESSKKKTVRDSNIELLRIITMMGVIVLHYNNKSIGGALEYVSFGSLNFHFLNFIESLFICAVDLFVLITGYFMLSTQKRNIIKPLKLVIQVIVFKLAFYLLAIIIGKTQFSINGLLGNVLPTNYFVILYTVLYFISPYINICMKSLNKIQLKQMMIVLFMCFSVYAIIADIIGDIKCSTIMGLSSIGMYGSQNGYTIVNFSFMYIIGAYIRICEEKFTCLSKNKLILIMLFLVSIDATWYFIFDYLKFNNDTSHSYLNPVVVIMAVVAFLFFKKINLDQNRIINKLAQGSFTVFLLHDVFLSYIKIETFVNKPLYILAAHIIISVIVIYLVCWLVHVIYECITAPIYKSVEKFFPKATYSVSVENLEKQVN